MHEIQHPLVVELILHHLWTCFTGLTLLIVVTEICQRKVLSFSSKTRERHTGTATHLQVLVLAVQKTTG